MAAGRAWWRPALFALSAPAITLALAGAVGEDEAMLLVAVSLVGVVPLSIALLASMLFARGAHALAAGVALGIDIILTMLVAPGGAGVFGALALLPFATALSLVWTEQRAAPSMLGLVGFAILAMTIVAPRFGLIGSDFAQVGPFLAVGSAASAASTLWSAWLMRPPVPAPAASIAPARPRRRAPLDARLAAWLTGAGLLVALSVGALPWAAPRVVLAVAFALLAVPAVVALREKPPTGITLGAIALLGLVPWEGCALFDALARTCSALPEALGYLWVLAIAGVAWGGLAAATR